MKIVTGQLYFTPAGKQNLIKRRAALSQKKAELLGLENESRGRSGIGHLSSAGLELDRQLTIEQQRLNDADFELAHCVVVYPPRDASKVAVGVNITIQRYDTDGNLSGGPERLHVGGYGSTDTASIPRTVCYNSPLARQFMDMTLGDVDGGIEVHFETGKREFIELLSIELPVEARQAAALKTAAAA